MHSKGMCSEMKSPHVASHLKELLLVFLSVSLRMHDRCKLVFFNRFDEHVNVERKSI